MIITRAFARPAILPRLFKIRKADRQNNREVEEKRSDEGSFFAQFEAMMSHVSAPMIKSMMDPK